jgi:hypothetical protein
MYRTIPVVVLAVGLSGAAHVAQSPSDDRLISRRSIKLTAEQEYVLRGYLIILHCCMVANANVLIAVSQRILCTAVNRPVAPPA